MCVVLARPEIEGLALDPVCGCVGVGGWVGGWPDQRLRDWD